MLSDSTRWKLTIPSFLLPFLLLSLSSWVHYSYIRSGAEAPSWTSLGLPIAMFSTAIPINLAPIKGEQYKVIFGVSVFIVTTLLLFAWLLVDACGFHGDCL